MRILEMIGLKGAHACISRSSGCVNLKSIGLKRAQTCVLGPQEGHLRVIGGITESLEAVGLRSTGLT